MHEKVTVFNHRDQPVELHLPSGVLIIAPGGTAELDAGDAAAPQLGVLARGRLISLWPAKQSPEQAASPGRRPAGGRQAKGKKPHAEGDE